jgi:hypothetical protein
MGRAGPWVPWPHIASSARSPVAGWQLGLPWCAEGEWPTTVSRACDRNAVALFLLILDLSRRAGAAHSRNGVRTPWDVIECEAGLVANGLGEAALRVQAAHANAQPGRRLARRREAVLGHEPSLLIADFHVDLVAVMPTN